MSTRTTGRARDERRGSRDKAGPTIAPEERARILLVVDETTAALLDEIEALKRGDVHLVVSLSDRKAAAAARLDEVRPGVEAYLAAGADPEFKERVRLLSDTLRRNQDGIERMRDAVRAIAAQIRKAEEKRSGDGAYGPRGRKAFAPPPEAPREIDTSL